jgi:hypothetical protein
VPEPHDFAVRSTSSQPKASTSLSIVRLRAIRQLTGLVDPPCHPLTSPDAAASTASRPAFVTTRDPPLLSERDGDGYRSDLGQPRTEIFLQMGLDRILADGLICPSGSFCIAVVARSEADEAIHACLASRWIASRSLSSGAHSRDPLARNDGEKSPPHQPVDETDARDGLSPSRNPSPSFRT